MSEHGNTIDEICTKSGIEIRQVPGRPYLSRHEAERVLAFITALEMKGEAHHGRDHQTPSES